MHSRSVLVVEDDRDTREMLREVLELEGYRVEEAADGEQALEWLGRTERFGLVVLDLRLPLLDGAAVLSAMAVDPALRRLPVVAISASLPSEPLPVAAFFHKPFPLEDFLARLSDLLPGRAESAAPRPVPQGQQA